MKIKIAPPIYQPGMRRLERRYSTSRWRRSNGCLLIANRHRQRRGIATLVVMIMAGVIGVLAVTMLRVSRNEQLRASVEHQRRVTRCAAQGAAHRAIAMLRRDPTLRGPVNLLGPEANIGINSEAQVSTNTAGQIVVIATSQYAGTIARQQIIVEQSRL